MKLVELIATLRDDILRDTSDRVGGDSDQLWRDDQMVRYINQAQRRFARRSLCIRDGSSAVTRFPLVAYQADYVLDPSIISVYSVRLLGNGAYVDGVYTTGLLGAAPIYPDRVDLTRTGHSARRAYVEPTDRAYYDTPTVGGRTPGKPLVFETDETMAEANGSAGVVTMHLGPLPSIQYAGVVVGMRVARLPAVDLSLSNLEGVPEIPEDYHVDMLDYAAYLALRVVDHEAGDTGRAQEFQQSFDRHVEEARMEIQRKTFVPLAWGFGGNGYSYSSN